MILCMLLIVWCLQIASAQKPPCEGSYKCLSFVDANTCPENQFFEIDPNISCCPQCRGGLGFGVLGCNPNNARKKCAPGLVCDESICELNKKLCSYTYHLSYFKNLPICEKDGKFAAKQCKGDKMLGRCFCFSEDGERIFGYDWWRNAENMTCACSRHRSRLEASGRLDVTLHCAQNGNYEELQCDSGVCWCADPKTGRLQNGTRAVPANLWTFLPCYNTASMGTKYLRQCESASYAQNLLRKTLALRGTTDVSFNNIQCDYDGSYGKYGIENGIAYCMWRDGKRIGSFQVNANLVSKMNCYCARDQKIFEQADLGFTLACMGNGNYEDIQGFNGKIFCVDRDGFAVTDYFDTITGLDCKQYLYYEVTKPLDI